MGLSEEGWRGSISPRSPCVFRAECALEAWPAIRGDPLGGPLRMVSLLP